MDHQCKINLNIENTAAFTGPRPHRFTFGENERHPKCIKLKAGIRSSIEMLCEKGVNRFLTGAAAGVDMWSGEIVLEIMKRRKEVELYSIIPFKDQAAEWTPDQQNRYAFLLENSTNVVLLNEKYYDGCYRDRNNYLITHAKYLIAVCGNLSGIRSGTQQTISMAKKNGNEIIHIDYYTV